MKTLIHWPMLCCVALLTSTSPAFAQPAVPTGHIFGAGPQAIYLVRARDFIDYKEWLGAVDSFQLKEDGLFHFSIPAEILKSYFRENYTDEGTYRKFLKVLYRFEPLRPGNPAPELALPSISGDTVRLSDFLGKVVYVDFWGTWCYPCLQELPPSLELQEKLKNEDVVFVYIGLESTGQVQEWREFVQGQRVFDYAPFLKQMVYPRVRRGQAIRELNKN